MIIIQKTYYLLLVILLFTHSISISSTAASDVTSRVPPSTISVTGTASDYYSPDTVEIILSVESSSLTASGAAEKNRTIMDRVIKRLKPLIDMAEDRMKTISYNLQPKYTYDRKQEKNLLTGYNASNQISVRTKKIDRAGDMIDRAIEAGANRVRNISFSIVETKEFCGTLLARAAGNARDEADTVASAFQTKISGIKEASSSCTPQQKRPVMMRYEMIQSAAAPKASTPVEAGDIQLTATVRTVFIIGE